MREGNAVIGNFYRVIAYRGESRLGEGYMRAIVSARVYVSA
jgi:hypothetical protein